MLSTRIPRSALLVAALGAATACATSSPGAFSRAQTDASAPRRPAAARMDLAAILDSVRAQAVADEVAPKVRVHANVTNLGSSRRVRATLQVDDDAYILVGHLGADGSVRVVFPLDPKDNGFVRGGRSYEVPEFFAGFEDEFRYRAVYDFRTRSFSPARYDSYDGGTGYVFVIASWRPMRFDQLDLGGRWVSFDVADEAYLRDPRPAIYELATLLVGGNREASSVEFARYYNTYYTPTGYSSYSSFCLGNELFGYGLSSFGPTFGYRQGFGRYGLLSPYSRYGAYGGGCGGGGSYYRPPTYGLAQAPFIPSATPSNPVPATLPVQPRPRPTPIGPGGIEPITVSPGTTSPEYRRRGLITVADDETAPRGAPRRAAGGTTVSDDQPPSIQERVNRRRVQEANTGAQTGGSEYTPRNPRERVISDPVETPPRANSARPRAEPVSEPRESPRAQPRAEPREEPRSAPRAEPRSAPRAEPRAEPIQPRAATPPAARPEQRPEPRSEPARPESRPAEPVRSPPTPPPAVRPITPITPA